MNPIWHVLNGVAVGPAISVGGVTSTGPLVVPDGLNTSPSIQGTGASGNSGVYFPFADYVGITNNNTLTAAFSTLGLELASAVAINWGSIGGALDVSLSRLAAGSLAKTGSNGSASNWRQATTSLSTVGGAGTVTATNLIPAGSLVIGIDARITTVIAGAGMASFAIGDGSDADRWGTGIALTAGTTVTLANATISTAPIYAAATSVVLTANAGQFDSGVIRLTVHYLSLTAATS